MRVAEIVKTEYLNTRGKGKGTFDPYQAGGIYLIKGWGVGCKGAEMSTQIRNSYIIDFEGEKEISSLSIYPKEFHDDPNYEQKLKKRGQRYWNFCVPAYRHYEGATIADRGESRREVRIHLDNMESSYRINNSISSLQQSHS
jgi:hypothetical protein